MDAFASADRQANTDRQAHTDRHTDRQAGRRAVLDSGGRAVTLAAYWDRDCGPWAVGCKLWAVACRPRELVVSLNSAQSYVWTEILEL